uniref:ShKT domain-containing protein n=1 Tax=Parastrongyloides trichosuri TaxID=131310 RepID=A0A0N4Z4N1_PARTI
MQILATSILLLSIASTVSAGFVSCYAHLCNGYCAPRGQKGTCVITNPATRAANTTDDCRFTCIQRCQTSCLAKAPTPSLCLNTCPTACSSACSSYLYVSHNNNNYLQPKTKIQTTTKSPLLPILDSNLFKPLVEKYHEVKNYLTQASSHIASEASNTDTNLASNVCHSECLTTCENQCDPNNKDSGNVCGTLCRPFCNIRCGILSNQFDLFSRSLCSTACSPGCSTVCVIKQGLKQLFDASNIPKLETPDLIQTLSDHLDPNVHFVKEATTTEKPKEILHNIKICVSQCVNRCARNVLSNQDQSFEKQISVCHSPCENVCKNKNNINGKKKCDVLKCNQNCMYQCYGVKNNNVDCENVCSRTCDNICMAPDTYKVSSHVQMLLKVDSLYKLDLMKSDCFTSCNHYSPRMANPDEGLAWSDICHKSCTSLDFERKRIMNVCSIGCQGQCKENCLYSDKGYAQCDPICKASCDEECGNKASKYVECEPNCLSVCNKNCKNKLTDFKCSISCYALCRNEACSKR